jgi:protein phosphatase-4 regulatory subunit 3
MPETLIVWTEPTTALDIALSFQDADGCEDVWQFIREVQKQVNTLPNDVEYPSANSESAGSPLQATAVSLDARTNWIAPSLSNIK